MATKRSAGVLLEVFKGSSAVLGEGALWSRKGLLWWIDIKGDAPAPSFNVFNPRNQKNHRYYMPSRIGTVVPVAGQNVALVALEDGLHALDLDTNELTCVVPMHRAGEPLRMNDGKCDPEGRFWVGDMFGKEWVDGAGTLYCLDHAMTLHSRIPGTTISNGLVWHGDKMYYIDTPTLRVDTYPYTPSSGELGPRGTPAAVFPADMAFGYPDGMALDADGNIWVACFNGGRVVQYNPRTGTLLREVLLPTTQVTSVAFGGPGLADLYVTTAREDVPKGDLGQLKHAFAGQLFRVTGLGVCGVPDQEFRPAEEAWAASLAAGAASTVVVPSEVQAFCASEVGADWVGAFHGSGAGAGAGAK